jgi:hypothetical protein
VNALSLSLLIFVLILGGIFLGALLRKMLPENHLSKEAQDVVRLGVGLVATMAALVLGLLIASAKTSFDTQTSQVKQITANIILLDTLLAQYGPEALPIRVQIRSGIGAFADKIWSEKQHRTNAPFEANAATEQIYIAIQALPPKSDLQKPLQARAAQVSNDLVQTRMLLFVGSGDLIPTPFLAILVFWLVIIFGSFSLFSNLNATVIAFLSLFALSASCAIFLILELSQPFSGLMMIASGPLRNALAPLGP